MSAQVRAYRAALYLEGASRRLAELLEAICDGAAMFAEAYPDGNVCTADGPVGVDTLRDSILRWEEALAEAKDTGILP